MSPYPLESHHVVGRPRIGKGGAVRRALYLLVPGILALTALSACSMATDSLPSQNTNSGGSSGTINTGGNTSSGNTNNGLPDVSFKQQPTEITFDGCPPQGDGGDPVLNMNKNRVDEGNYQLTDFSALETLPWPSSIERRDHANWPADAAAQVAQYEGLPVAIVGYLALARKQGAESTNCHSTTDADFHIWLIDHPGTQDDRPGSIVVEATPRVRANHPGWTVAALNHLAEAGTQVRISGWTMLDPEHPDQVGQTRGTIWEIHPVMRIDVWQNGSWVPLDNYQG